MKKIYVSAPFYGIGNQILKNSSFEVEFGGESILTKEQWLEKIKDKDAVITYVHDKLDSQIIESASNLKVISNYAVGVDNIDLAAAKKKGILVGNTPDVLTYATAELALTLMLNCGREIKSAYTDAINKKWKKWIPMGYLGPGLQKATIGIIGLGRIGRKLAQMLHDGFGAKVIYYSREDKKVPFAHYVDLETLYQKSDYISVHMASNQHTRSFFRMSQFNKMKNSCIFINTARGDLVEEADLIKALDDGQISYAGLDVTSPEPPEKDSPLYSHEKIFLLPHIGSATFFAREEMGRIAAENVVRALNGAPLLHEVNHA